MPVPADLVFAAANAETLREIASWDGFRPATFAASEFPVDVVRFDRSPSPPVVLSRARRAETLKALPAGLRERAVSAFARFEKANSSVGLPGGRRLDLSTVPIVMGVVNVTPDSFSDGGLYFDPRRAAERALEMFEEGAAIVDIGGESTRPATYGDSAPVSPAEEMRRVLPVIEAIRRESPAHLSIDTRNEEVARAALGAGVDLVNDVSALRHDPKMAATVAEAGAALLLMHMKGDDPRTMQADTSYDHPVADVASGLTAAASNAIEAGVPADRIVVDPGLGFGKTAEGNLVLLRFAGSLKTLGFPVAVGASRKAFVRRFSGVGDDASPAERLAGSLAAVAAARAAGTAIVRVHDVADTVRFLRMQAAIDHVALARPERAASR